jgi:hypothetical protein
MNFGANEGELKVFNPNKEISKEITLEILIRHRDALKQARTGEIPNTEIRTIKDNERKFNQVRGLNLIIAAQREMITASRPIVFFRSTQKWKKKYREEEDQEKHPFPKDDNDYNKMMEHLKFLTYCEQAIIKAEKSKTLEDDFIVKRQTTDGEIFDLTENFHDMLADLEESYEQIYLLMLTNKIVSAGIEEDEELTYKEKEQEAIRRVVEA